MIPSTLDLPMPPSLALETSWSLRNLLQIATNRHCDLVKRTSLCIAYVNNSNHFEAVTASWSHIANKGKTAPILAICVPSLPKGAQVEWQVMLHHGKVYAEKKAAAADEDDGNDTDDDDMYQLEKRALHPTTLTLCHEPSEPTSVAWKSTTRSWFLAPLLSILSVVDVANESLSSMFSSLALADDKMAPESALSLVVLKDMMAMIIQAVDRVLDSNKSPKLGPGVEEGWKDVVGMTLYYQDTLVGKKDVKVLRRTFEDLLKEFLGPESSVAVTFVPVQAIAGNGVLALTTHAVGKTPTVPGLLQQYL